MTGAEVGRLQQGAYPQHILIPDARSVEKALEPSTDHSRGT
jgi:hypothetical protein